MLSDAELETLYRQLLDAVGRADRPRALRLAEEAEAEGLEEPLVLVLAAEAVEDRGEPAGAVALLRRAVELAPDDAETWRRLALALGGAGDREEAAIAAERAGALAPEMPAGSLAAGAARFSLGEFDAARTHYERARTLTPELAGPLEGLAAIAGRRGDHEAAADLSQAALARAPDSVSARLTQLRSALARGEASGVERSSTELLARPGLTGGEKIAVLDVRAEARDALGLVDAAFEDYGARNTLIARASLAPDGEERRLDQAVRLRRELAGLAPARWAAIASEDLRGREAVTGHVFLLGFPRSGTTLLEKALAGHPRAATLEEVDCLGRAAGDLLSQPGGLERLLTTGAAELKRRRGAYWDGVRERLGERLAGRVLIDKMPLHTLALPAIARLFPQARILFALRDPRDVVLSCFRRRFVMNAAMREFLTLEGAARYYDAVMALAKEARSVLPLSVTEVRHEALVEDFDGEAARVLDFAGLDWHPGVRDFAGRARARPRTPSDLQLVGGLSREGLGQWRRYAGPLAPVLPLLAPWVERWGYPAA